jgi:hypothetical protein
MDFFPSLDRLNSMEAASAPGETRSGLEGGDFYGTTLTVAETELAIAVSRALRRGLIAKFFATLGAEDELRADLQAVCREARQQNIRVEQLIIAFKEAWRTLPEARTLPRGAQGPEFLGHVITRCIAEFYSPSSSRAD